MEEGAEDMLALDLQLSDEEYFLLGKIIAHWGAIEHAIFIQTLMTFDDAEVSESLPKTFNNIQFTETLALWRERVLGKAEGDQLASLTNIHDEILRLKAPRDALVHGMWHWSPDTPNVISTIRAKKREVIITKFSTDFLRDLELGLAKLNFRIRYPGGITELVAERMQAGLHLSRKGFEMLFGKPSKSPDST
ncbi:MAG TPA: hypothetical protein VMA55_00280 [Acidovorax sp.]|nr:hypothetical protein [Acidovorax sp.]